MLRNFAENSDSGDDIIFWIGGNDQEEEGFWQWTDGSVWNYTDWGQVGNLGNKGESMNCVQMNNFQWSDGDCSAMRNFICQSSPCQLTGKTNLTLVYDRQNVKSFRVWYSYQSASKVLLDSWKERRMTGFRLTWMIEPLPLEVTTSEVGRSIQTPGLGGEAFDRTSFMTDRSYKASLQFPDDIKEKIGSGSLVIALDVDIRKDGVGQEQVKTNIGGENKFQLYREKKSW